LLGLSYCLVFVCRLVTVSGSNCCCFVVYPGQVVQVGFLLPGWLGCAGPVIVSIVFAVCCFSLLCCAGSVAGCARPVLYCWWIAFLLFFVIVHGVLGAMLCLIGCLVGCPIGHRRACCPCVMLFVVALVCCCQVAAVVCLLLSFQAERLYCCSIVSCIGTAGLAPSVPVIVLVVLVD
jgi:hypothetical protein